MRKAFILFAMLLIMLMIGGVACKSEGSKTTDENKFAGTFWLAEHKYNSLLGAATYYEGLAFIDKLTAELITQEEEFLPAEVKDGEYEKEDGDDWVFYIHSKKHIEDKIKEVQSVNRSMGITKTKEEIIEEFEKDGEISKFRLVKYNEGKEILCWGIKPRKDNKTSYKGLYTKTTLKDLQAKFRGYKKN